MHLFIKALLETEGASQIVNNLFEVSIMITCFKAV